MKGLKIKTVTGMEFEIYGEVKYNYEFEIYYCAGESWPVSIVMEVLK